MQRIAPRSTIARGELRQRAAIAADDRDRTALGRVARDIDAAPPVVVGPGGEYQHGLSAEHAASIIFSSVIDVIVAVLAVFAGAMIGAAL